MKTIYIRVHPDSPMGISFTKAHSEGWALVGFNREGYPILRERFLHKIRRIIFREPHYLGEE